MKSRSSTVGPFLLTLIAVHGVASIRIVGQSNGYLTDGRNTQFNDNFETFSNQESNNDSSDIEVGELNTNDCGDDCEYLKTGNNNQYLPNSGPNEQLSHNPYHSNVAGQNDNDDHNRSNNDSFHNRSEQSSIESFEYGNEAAGEPQVLPDDTFRMTCPEFGRRLLDKIKALDEIVATGQRHGHGDLLDVEDPLPVKKYAVKVDRQEYVSFRATELRHTGGAVLEYLSVDVAGDRVRVGCTFDGLSGNGTYKTNVAHSKKRGPYTVDMHHVRSNVTAHFHRGRRVGGSVRAGSFAVDGPPTTASVDARYQAAVEHSVRSAVYQATHRGLVARIKAELNARVATDGSVTLCDPYLNGWTGTGGRPLDSVSYTRLGNRTYRMRFDVRLQGPTRWTSHADAASGHPGSPPPVDFVANGVRVRVAVVRSIGGDRGCREIDVNVHVAHLVSLVHGQIDSVTTRPTDDFQRYFAARLKDSLRNTVCNNSVLADPETS